MRTIVERIAVIAGVAFATAGVCLIWVTGVKYEKQLAELRTTQDELSAVQNRRATYQRLVQNLVAYSQSQPAIDSVLVPFGFKAAPQPPQAQPQQPTQPSQQLQQFQQPQQQMQLPAQTQQSSTGTVASPTLRPSPARPSTPNPAPK